MNEAQEEIARIRAARAAKGGRMSNAEKARIEELEAMSDETTETTEETPEAVPEAPEAPEGMVNVKVTASTVCIPSGEMTKMVYEGEVVAVPEQFLEDHGDKVEKA